MVAAGVARLAGASQLNTLSVGPLNVHSAAAGVTVFFGLEDLSESAAVVETLDALDAPEAADTFEAPDASAAFDAPYVAAALEAARGALAAFAAFAAEAPDAAATTCSIDPSTTTRDPRMPAPACEILSASGDVSASLLRINCSHASVFL